MKKSIFMILWLFILTWCFWGDSNPSSTGLVVQEREDFLVPIPSTWSQIQEQDLVTPTSWNIALAFKSQNERQWYINNIVILQEENTSSSSSQAILNSAEQALKKGIKWYNLISNNTVEFADGEVGNIMSYSWKYSADTPETVYIQSVRTCSENTYYMTISLTEVLDSYDRYEYILQSFRCR